jgi:anti-anti-sigma factor
MAASPGPAPALKFETERTAKEIIVRCTGKINVETAALFQETIRALIPEGKCVVIDLANVPYLDSVGLGALVDVWSSARRRSAEMGFLWPDPHAGPAPYEVRLIRFNEHIRKLLQLTRLDKIFRTSDQD